MFKSACVWETPFYASFSVKKKVNKQLGTQRHQQAVGSSHFGPAVGPFYKQLLQFARDKIQMVPERWELSSQNYKMNSGILFDTLGDKV